jgi:hypothetical protein
VSGAIADKDAGVKKYLHDFGTQLFKASVQKMTDDEMKKLLDAEHQLDAKLRDEQRAKMEIIMLNCDIKRREEDNTFIVKEQAYNDQQIARQRDLIEKSKGKVDAITGKAKGKPEGVSAESQRVLDNLLKQKTSLEKEAQKNTLDGTLDRDKIKESGEEYRASTERAGGAKGSCRLPETSGGKTTRQTGHDQINKPQSTARVA